LIHNSSWIQGDHPDPEFAQFRDAGHGEARVMFSRWDLLFFSATKERPHFSGNICSMYIYICIYICIYIYVGNRITDITGISSECNGNVMAIEMTYLQYILDLTNLCIYPSVKKGGWEIPELGGLVRWEKKDIKLNSGLSIDM
jgi:hypothetical protein